MLRYFAFLLPFFLLPQAGETQPALVQRQLELYGGIGELPIPTLRSDGNFNRPDTTGAYYMDPENDRMAFFGLGYRRDWDNGRYFLLSIPRLILGGSRNQQLNLLPGNRGSIRQQFNYYSLRGEYGYRYFTQNAVSFLIGFGLEGVLSQTKNTPVTDADTYYSRMRIWGSQLAISLQVQWRLRRQLSLHAGIDPLAISMEIEESYAEDPRLEPAFWNSSIFDLEFISGNHLHLGLVYRLEE